MMDGAYPPGVTGDMIPEGPDDMWIPEPCCRYCEHFIYNRNCCTKEWNNLDEGYYNQERDDRDEYDWCDNYSWTGETLEMPRKPEKPDRGNRTDMQWTWAMRYYRQEMNKWQKAMLAIREEREGKEEQ